MDVVGSARGGRVKPRVADGGSNAASRRGGALVVIEGRAARHVTRPGLLRGPAAAVVGDAAVRDGAAPVAERRTAFFNTEDDEGHGAPRESEVSPAVGENCDSVALRGPRSSLYLGPGFA